MDFHDLQVTAELARLNMDQRELQGAYGAFEEMLAFFAAMDSAGKDTAAFSAAIERRTDGEPVSARRVDAAYFRPDAPNPGHTGPDPEDLLGSAGERDGPFIVIPNVL
jgi:aspartyl-tRNA(Asn)/glutamyl-tRNA(Gln) amidotransferase subunit C